MPFVLCISAALAASPSPPSAEEAAAFVDAVVDVVADGRASRTWAARTFRPWELDGASASVQVAWHTELDAHLDPQGDWTLLLERRPRVEGTIPGPDYTRVVLEGTGWTVKVRRLDTELVVEDLSPSACALCAEPERFLRDLFAQVDGRDDAAMRLLPGAELAVQPWLDEEGPGDVQRWARALQNRNARAGYLWWLLREAEVEALVAERQVRVRLATGPEGWTVVYRDHRWQVDYATLPEGSALRLEGEDIAHWTSIGQVRRETLRYWRPTWAQRSEGLLVDEGALFVAERPLQGDLVTYHQDMASRWAMIARLDPETGEVLGTVAAPRVPMSFFLPTHGWWDWLELGISPDGSLLAVGIQTRLWVLEVDTGRVRLSATRLPRVVSLDWSSDGRWLVVGDIFGNASLYETERLEKVAQARSSGRPLHGFAWLEGALLAVDEVGAVHRYELPGLRGPTMLDRACCGAVRGVDRLPSTGEVVVGCAGSCDPAWIWRWDPKAHGPPQVLADARLRGSSGALAADPSGRFLVVAHRGEGGAMALWDLRDERILATFSELPLRQVSWSGDGDTLWGVDLAGRTWRFEVGELLAR